MASCLWVDEIINKGVGMAEGKEVYKSEEKQVRYAIVRVDERCPVEEEEDISLVDRIKMFPCFNDKRLSCKKCRYGDTKEQLIRKVAQAIFRRKLRLYRYI